MAKTGFKIEGMKDLQKSIFRLGKVPQKVVASAAKKGMNPILRKAKSKSPIDTGNLRTGIKLAGERSKTKGKKVYRVVFDKSMNDLFQKRNKEGQIIAYYPISMEYGYFTKNGRYIPGYNFIHDSLTDNANKSAQIMIDTMKKSIETEIKKVGLK